MTSFTFIEDCFYEILLHSTLDNLIKLSSLNKKNNKLLSSNDKLWLNYLDNDYDMMINIVNDCGNNDNGNNGNTPINNLDILKKYLPIKEIIILSDRNYFIPYMNKKEMLESIILNGSIDLGYIEIKKIPKKIFMHKNLKELILSHNSINKIPKNISLCENMTKLMLNSNQIKKIPKEIKYLHNLLFLHLGNNLIKKINQEICMLPNLIYLNLNENKIKSLPSYLSKLTSLQQLILTNNNISEVPIPIRMALSKTQISFSYGNSELLCVNLRITEKS